MLANILNDAWFWLTQPILQGLEAGLAGENAGWILMLLGIVLWAIIAVIFKFMIFDTAFPKIRVLDAYKNTLTYCRRVINTKGDDPNAAYMMVKFKLRPLFRWHKLKLPKKGVNGVKWRRMPSTLDIITKDIYLNWNEHEECYQLGLEDFSMIDDDWDYYNTVASENIRTVGTSVADAVKGDYDLMKKQFQLELPITVQPKQEIEFPKTTEQNINEEEQDLEEEEVETEDSVLSPENEVCTSIKNLGSLPFTTDKNPPAERPLILPPNPPPKTTKWKDKGGRLSKIMNERKRKGLDGY